MGAPWRSPTSLFCELWGIGGSLWSFTNHRRCLIAVEVKPELWGAMGSYVSSCGLAAGGLVAVAVQRGAAGVSKWGMEQQAGGWLNPGGAQN